MADTSFLAIWDADVILNPLQLLLGLEMLRHDEADMVFPFDGNFYAVPKFIKEVFLQHMDRLEILEHSIGRMTLMHNFPSVGGGFLAIERPITRLAWKMKISSVGDSKMLKGLNAGKSWVTGSNEQMV